jgi:hypothetical protein
MGIIGQNEVSPHTYTTKSTVQSKDGMIISATQRDTCTANDTVFVKYTTRNHALSPACATLSVIGMTEFIGESPSLPAKQTCGLPIFAGPPNAAPISLGLEFVIRTLNVIRASVVMSADAVLQRPMAARIARMITAGISRGQPL